MFLDPATNVVVLFVVRDLLNLRNRLPIGGGCVYVMHMFFFVFFCFFPSVKNMRQLFSGTAEPIFMKLLPNDTGENVV